MNKSDGKKVKIDFSEKRKTEFRTKEAGVWE